MPDEKTIESIQKENSSLKSENDSLVKTQQELKSTIENIQKDNDSLALAQQELKVKVKQLTELPPKTTSRYKRGSVKYVRQDRTKSD